MVRDIAGVDNKGKDKDKGDIEQGLSLTVSLKFIYFDSLKYSKSNL